MRVADLHFLGKRQLILCCKHTRQLCWRFAWCSPARQQRERPPAHGGHGRSYQGHSDTRHTLGGYFRCCRFPPATGFSGCIICLHRQHFRVIRRIGGAGENGTDALRHHGTRGHGIHQHTGDEEQNPCDQEALLVAHDECPCLLCLFFYRPCGFSSFGRSLGGISGSLTGALGGGILLFDGLLLLPAGKRIAGKLGIFLQGFLVQDIYICLFQLALCLGCFAVRLQLVAAVASRTR